MTGAPEDVQDALRGASALVALENTKIRRMRFLRLPGPNMAVWSRRCMRQVNTHRWVTVLLDGREAADIAPLDAPGQISRIDVRVETGPQFRFGQTRITPLAAGTDLPEDFAPAPLRKAAWCRRRSRQASTAGALWAMPRRGWAHRMCRPIMRPAG